MGNPILPKKERTPPVSLVSLFCCGCTKYWGVSDKQLFTPLQPTELTNPIFEAEHSQEPEFPAFSAVSSSRSLLRWVADLLAW